jgi:hypothetical protein
MGPRFALVAVALMGCTSTEDPSMSPSYSESRRLAIELASARQLLASLDELEGWHAEEATSVAGRLAPGLGATDLDEIRVRLGAPLPADLVTLYQWHDGTRGGCDDFAGPAFLAYHCLLPLQQALDIRDRDRRLLGLPGTWLPVLYFQEEYLYVLLEDPAPAALPVFHRLVESDDVVAFANLRTMVDTFLEAARAGVWRPDDDTLVDWSAVETIRARLNPGTSPPWAP